MDSWTRINATMSGKIADRVAVWCLLSLEHIVNHGTPDSQIPKTIEELVTAECQLAKKYLSKVFAIVGMNSIFIYLFSEVGGGDFLYRIVKPFSMALFFWSSTIYAQIFTSLIAWGLLWCMCFWLYKRKIFIKI